MQSGVPTIQWTSRALCSNCQKSGEKFDTFLTSLKTLAKDCEYRELEDSLIKYIDRWQHMSHQQVVILGTCIHHISPLLTIDSYTLSFTMKCVSIRELEDSLIKYIDRWQHMSYQQVVILGTCIHHKLIVFSRAWTLRAISPKRAIAQSGMAQQKIVR